MKKLNALLVLLALTAGVFAQQGPFTLIGWPDMTAAGPFGYDFNATPYAKAEATALKSKSDVVIDMAAIDEIGIKDIWSRIGAPNIAGLTNANSTGGDPFDLTVAENGVDVDGTFGVAWKAFWDAENLYVIVEYVDNAEFAKGSAGSDTKALEISFQTKAKDRYEAGYAAATDVYGLTGKNAQYGRYAELGGGKAKIVHDADNLGSVSECLTSIGQTGAWGSSLGAANTPAVSWNLQQDKTVWAIVQFNFADYLMYLNDEWGTSTPENEVAFDPTAIPTISFDVKSDANVGASDAPVEYWWSSNVNEGYCLIYFNGYLTFSTDEWVPVGKTNYLKPADKSAYIYDNILKFKGYDSPVNVDVYSVVGQKVKSATNVSTLSVADLTKGVYVVKVGDDVYKVMK